MIECHAAAGRCTQGNDGSSAAGIPIFRSRDANAGWFEIQSMVVRINQERDHSEKAQHEASYPAQKALSQDLRFTLFICKFKVKAQ